MKTVAHHIVDCTMSGQPPYNCEGCDLSGRDLAGKDLTNAILKNANLTGTRFCGVVSLRGADLTGAVIGGGTDFAGCDLSSTAFRIDASIDNLPAKLAHPHQQVSFVGATIPFSALGMTWRSLDLTDTTVIDLPQDLSGLEVVQCTLTRFDFSGRGLKNAHFASTVLRGANFSKGVLDHVVFEQVTDVSTDLTEALFCAARIFGGVFHDATLTSADFSDVTTLSGASFLNARMDGTVFDRTDLTTCHFSAPPYWSDDPKHLTSFRGATLNYDTLQTNWSFLDLTDAHLVGLDKTVDLTRLDARYAVLSDWNLDGYTLKHCNLEGATLEAASFVGAHMEWANLAGTRGDQPVFDDANLTPGVSFGNQLVGGAVLHGASFQRAKLAGAYLKGADFGPTLDRVVSKFDGAQMQNVTATNGNFTAARFTGGVLLSGASFAYATLTSADLTGARLASSSEMFRVDDKDGDFKTLFDGLTRHDLGKVAAVFQNNHGISSPPKEIDGVEPSWTVRCDVAYRVLLHEWADQTRSFLVLPATSAVQTSLSYAFMPGVIFTDAILYGVDASYAELWPLAQAHQFAGAMMDRIVLTNAILGTDNQNVDLTNASLVDADLTNAFLMNADFGGAALNGAKFDNAQLQGANFTTAVMTGAQLTNAAVAVAATDQTDGVWLFDVSGADRDALCIELEAAAAGQFELVADDAVAGIYDQYVADLEGGDLVRVRQGFSNNSNGRATLESSATVSTMVDGLVWQIDDTAGTRESWIVWAVPQEKELKARPLLPVLTRIFFDKFRIQLRWRATVDHETDDDQRTLPSWNVDNDSGSPDNLTTGYVQFLVTQSKSIPPSLSVYGTAMNATQGLHQQAMVTIEVKATTLNSDSHTFFLAPDTTCPNGARYEVNKLQGIPLNEALRATAPPTPPRCVPSRFASCNAPPPD